MLNTEGPIGEIMASVIQNSPHTALKHHVNGLANTANAQDNSGSGQGIDAFMLEIEQAIQARQQGQDLSPQNQAALLSAKNILANALQNLPKSANNAGDPAKIADQMQLLSASLVAQGLLTQPIPGLSGANIANAAAKSSSTQDITSVQNTMTGTSIAQALLSQNNLGSASALALLKAQANANGLAQNSQNTAQANASQVSQAAQAALAADGQNARSNAVLPSNVGSNKDQAIKVLALETQGASNNPISNQAPVLVGAGQTLGDLTPKQASVKASRFNSNGFDARGASQTFGVISPAKALAASGTPQSHASALGADKTPAPPLEASSTETAKNLSNTKDDSAIANNAVSGELAGSNVLGNLQPHLAATASKVQIAANDASLASGPMHAQIMNAARSGGGRIAIELTPPGQGTIRIDLRIDQAGQAHLIVEGASDATKARLDHGGQQLKNDFAQMGLNLSLDMRQGGSFSQAQNQSPNSQQFSGFDSNSVAQVGATPVNSLVSSSKPSDNIDNSAVHLYA
jgi:hypothetical protein